MKKQKPNKKGKGKGKTGSASSASALMYEGAADPDAAAKWQEFMGPQAVDQAVRQAITTCWMLLPEGKKTVAAVEAEIRRLVERALQNLKEDAQAFGIPTPPASA
jgi:hypothetical protein